jgi:hypothetical protein
MKPPLRRDRRNRTARTADVLHQLTARIRARPASSMVDLNLDNGIPRNSILR